MKDALIDKNKTVNEELNRHVNACTDRSGSPLSAYPLRITAKSSGHIVRSESK